MKVQLDIKGTTIISLVLILGVGFLAHKVYHLWYADTYGEKVKVCATVVDVTNCDHTGVWCGAKLDDGRKVLAKMPHVGDKICHEENK